MFNFDNIEQSKSLWQNGKPFHHLVIDNFMPEDIAEEVAKQFPKADSDFCFAISLTFSGSESTLASRSFFFLFRFSKRFCFSA